MQTDQDLVTLHLQLEEHIHKLLQAPQSHLHPFYACVDAMNKCPIILQLYHLTYHESTIKYCYIHDLTTTEAVTIASLRHDILTLQH